MLIQTADRGTAVDLGSSSQQLRKGSRIWFVISVQLLFEFYGISWWVIMMEVGLIWGDAEIVAQ